MYRIECRAGFARAKRRLQGLFIRSRPVVVHHLRAWHDNEMLADFAVRLAFGLSVAVFLISWRSVPLPFFRTQLQVVLGLVVLAALDQAKAGGPALHLWSLVAAAVLAYVSAATWGLGLPRVGQGTAAAGALILVGWMVGASHSSTAGLGLLNASSRAASGFVLGVTLSAMLLGHYYLTAPAMSIEPLLRMFAFMAWGLGARCLLAALGLSVTHVRHSALGSVAPGGGDGLFLAARWGMGFGGAAVATYLAWRTAHQINSVGHRNPLHRHHLHLVRRVDIADYGKSLVFGLLSLGA